jgi:hypothetical protein
MAELDALNEEWRARLAYRKTPQGIAERKRWRTFLAMGREVVKSGEPMAVVYRQETGNEL